MRQTQFPIPSESGSFSYLFNVESHVKQLFYKYGLLQVLHFTLQGKQVLDVI